MTEVLHSPSHFPSPPSTTSSSPSSSSVACIPPQSPSSQDGIDEDDEELVKQSENNKRDQLSLLALLVELLRKSLVACKEFNGFLGLPVEFEPEVPRRPPSASTTVFGVSTESMQLSYDSRGNSVPTILLLMQRRLYAQGGLQAEGIFRIAAENSQEERVREQLNGGEVSEGVDVHCLAGLIKAWFRELPTGVLDSLSPEQVIDCRTEDDCAFLARNLPPTEAALLDWAINLMADVVQQEHLNKMNAHNVATVFAPNMTQMADPMTALMYAVQVMNFLKTLILRTLRERKDSMVEPSPSRVEPFDNNSHESPSLSHAKDSEDETETTELAFVAEEPAVESTYDSSQYNAIADEADLSYATSADEADLSYATSVDKLVANRDRSCETASDVNDTYNHRVKAGNQAGIRKNSIDQSSSSSLRKSPGKFSRQSPALQLTPPSDKTRGTGSFIDARSERIEAWR
ncbi:hypothetical protein OIU84_015168 [Salix udensis]|uniref:Rho-GAP domain-containing protein n=1 Tax=Salix udensis TaxID=889485 RepID=A0AAD6JDU5_9ROSI|nr:hypothetical protein OIU84_015168 [Salix udensis]